MIRRAVPQDARALAEVQVRAWMWAYSDFVDPGDMKTVEEREAQWSGGDLLAGTWVADVGGRVAGFVVGGPSRDDGAGEATGEIYAIYVDPPAQGAGVGDALLARELGELRAAGFIDATLWVFADNGLARRFYEARGWTPDGATGDWLGAAGLRYRRAL